MRAIRQSLIIIGFCFVPIQANADSPDKTVIALEVLAQSGSTRAQFELARRFETGIGTTSNSAKAFDLYCKAAAKGHPMAAYRLGSLYLSGKGVARDNAMAAAWFRRSIELGHAEAKELMPIFGNVKQLPVPGCYVAGARGFEHMPAPAQIEKMVRGMAPEFGLDPNFVLAIMQIESGYRTDAVSPRNAQGLMQLIPETAERFGVKDPFDVKDNVRGGMRYLRWLLAYFRGDVSLVAAAYNAGEGAVERYRGVPPYKETETYVKRLNAVYPRKRHPFESRIAKASDVFTSGVSTPGVSTRAEVAELD
jgi:soluble lytic murein transglycosylase-like protein